MITVGGRDIDLLQRTRSAATKVHVYENAANTTHSRTHARAADSLVLIAAMSFKMSQWNTWVSVDVTPDV